MVEVGASVFVFLEDVCVEGEFLFPLQSSRYSEDHGDGRWRGRPRKMLISDRLSCSYVLDLVVMTGTTLSLPKKYVFPSLFPGSSPRRVAVLHPTLSFVGQQV